MVKVEGTSVSGTETGVGVEMGGDEMTENDRHVAIEISSTIVVEEGDEVLHETAEEGKTETNLPPRLG